MANEPPRIKSKAGVLYYKVDRNNSETVDFCRALIHVCCFLHTFLTHIGAYDGVSVQLGIQ